MKERVKEIKEKRVRGDKSEDDTQHENSDSD